jgi:hypothetical protein
VIRLPLETLIVAAVIAAGTAFRATELDGHPFWVDEAESAMNALTILEQGYPGDTYLGLPIYENTLVEPWPEHPEYEFRDISYSNRMAVYHGWLPLYSIAASFALHGVRPDKPPASLHLRQTLEEQRRRTRAGRAPAVFFGAALMLLVFIAGTEMYGRDAGWAALIVACAHSYLIDASRQARYYSAAILLTTACCYVLWLMVTRGQWKHFLWGGLLFVLLFHTHLLSFAASSLTLLLMAPAILLRHEKAFRKLFAFAVIVLGGSLPWIWVTRFYSHQNRIPRGWSLLSLPGDLIILPPARAPYMILFGAFVLAAVLILIMKPSWLARWKATWVQSWRPVGFLAVWVACGYVCFLLFMPAASFFASRLKLAYWGPMLLGASIICASLARLIAPRMSRIVAPVVIVAIATLVTNPLGRRSEEGRGQGWVAMQESFERVAAMHPDRTTKLYALPNGHLVYTFYSALPFQSILPVRRSFLDRYEGDVIYVDFGEFRVDDGPMSPASIRTAAERAGVHLAEGEAFRWSRLLATRDYRERMLIRTGGNVATELEQVPEFATGLIEESRTERRRYILQSMHPALMSRGFDVTNWSEWSEVFFYRFVDPRSRSGTNANYAGRLRGTTGLISMNSHTVIYRSAGGDPRERESAGSVRFEIVE